MRSITFRHDKGNIRERIKGRNCSIACRHPALNPADTNVWDDRPSDIGTISSQDTRIIAHVIWSQTSYFRSANSEQIRAERGGRVGSAERALEGAAATGTTPAPPAASAEGGSAAGLLGTASLAVASAQERSLFLKRDMLVFYTDK